MLIEELKKIRKELLERIEGQKKALDYLDKVINTLGSVDDKPTTTITPHEFPGSPSLSCPRCGLLTKDMTHYVCNDINCPIFMRVI